MPSQRAQTDGTGRVGRKRTTDLSGRARTPQTSATGNNEKDTEMYDYKSVQLLTRQTALLYDNRCMSCMMYLYIEYYTVITVILNTTGVVINEAPRKAATPRKVA